MIMISLALISFYDNLLSCFMCDKGKGVHNCSRE